MLAVIFTFEIMIINDRINLPKKKVQILFRFIDNITIDLISFETQKVIHKSLNYFEKLPAILSAFEKVINNYLISFGIFEVVGFRISLCTF